MFRIKYKKLKMNPDINIKQWNFEMLISCAATKNIILNQQQQKKTKGINLSRNVLQTLFWNSLIKKTMHISAEMDNIT